MAKQLSSFSKIVISGATAFVLVGGAVASLRLAEQNQNTQSRAYDSSVWSIFKPRPITTPVPGVQCYNRVIVSGGNYFWPDACRGRVGIGMCAQVLTALTTQERTQYQRWVELGRPAIAGCVTATPSPRMASPVPADVKLSNPSAPTAPGGRMTNPVQTVVPGVRY